DLGLSVGDDVLQREILANPAFRGFDGNFSRDNYRLALDNAGLSEAEYEAGLRRDTTRALLQGAVLGGVDMPARAVDTVMEFIGARRSFTWVALTPGDLAEPIPAPTDADIRAFYDDNPDLFTLPETKDITYALLSPAMILDTVEVDEAALRTRYEELSDEFNQPERRLVERLVFEDEDAASRAKAQLEVGGTSFDLLVADRDLTLDDIDLGDVTIEDLGDAGEAILAGDINDVLGPLPSEFGPALFRINGILSARSTSFEEAEPALRDELAADRARRVIEAQAQDMDDLLAGGATLEELAEETEMELGQIGWSVESADGVAAYDGFRSAASAATPEDFPAIDYLEDGSIFALRVDDVLPPRPEPFADAQTRAAEGARLQAQQAALEAAAAGIITDLAATGDFTAAGLVPNTEAALTRTAFIEGTPTDFMAQVFDMAPGDLQVVSGDGIVTIVRLDDTLAPADTPEAELLRNALAQDLNQSLAQDMFDAYAVDTQLRAGPQIDQQAINAVQANFP
ncbi:MAG: peptidyl-prolyl cis-trans isomerase, partial [Marinibacterium sp.]|nr:peptidyl-prolyl cis-trans isomerase [Marinibacterium sp.]